MSATASVKVLPSSTVRLLGSTQVLLDACSVIKELVENALDAKATSISAEISTNGLDVLQVRDNGFGIAPKDRDVVCRRYTTSKIVGFEELRNLGGDSLGFRGEALHSLCEMSKGLSITTRVEGEAAAVNLTIGRDGEVGVRATASHPVGTTVRATEFLHNVPVRKQTALKAAPKCLTRIKRVLQSYALARPEVRISLRVLKAKSEVGNFLYAPKAGGGTVEDAVFKILGNDCASECEWTVLDSNGFAIQAFLPRIDATVSKIANIGQFLSVDSRPVSNSKGTFKQVVTLFKAKLRGSAESFDGVKDPFLYLNIRCPAASYDPNVEPAKDDVLFDDSSRVLSVIEELMTATYRVHEKDRLLTPEPSSSSIRVQDVPEPIVPRNADHVSNPPILSIAKSIERAPSIFTEDDETHLLIDRAFGVSLSRNRQNSLVEDDQVDSFGGQRDSIPLWKSNMFATYEEDQELLPEDMTRPSTMAGEHPSETARDFTISNSWTIAKMNAPVRSSPVRNTYLPMITEARTPIARRDFPEMIEQLTTPIHSDQDQFPTLQPRKFNEFTPVSKVRGQQPNLTQYGLATPQTSSPPSWGTPLNAIPKISKRRRKQSGARCHPNNIHIAPQRQSNWFNFDPSSGSTGRRARQKGPEGNGGNHDIRDMIGNSVSRISQHRALVSQGEPDDLLPPRSSSVPPLDRYPDLARRNGSRATGSSNETADLQVPNNPLDDEMLLDLAAVQLPRERAKSVNTTLPTRKRRRTTESRRTKSSRLPLERVPEHAQMHNLILPLYISSSAISVATLKFDQNANFINWHDEAEEAYDTFTIAPSTAELLFWSREVVDALKNLYDAGDMDVGFVQEGILAQMSEVEWYEQNPNGDCAVVS